MLCSLLFSIAGLLHAGRAFAAAATDEYQDADPAQSGYLPNHNIHPSVVNSSLFGELWRVAFSKNEKFYAKPLVYTPSIPGSRQMVILASTQNKIYAVDAVNGTIIRTRELVRPFQVADLDCSDLPNTIGVVGTPVIDPSTDVMFFYSKTYRGTANGVENGLYQFYGVNVADFTDVSGYPMVIDGHHADNDVGQYFTGGTHLQRPSLALINGVVYGAFGSHCDRFNYTGWIFAVNTDTRRIVSIFSTAVSPFTPPQDGTFNGGGGGSALWQGGMGLSTDSSSRLFFVTGNGDGHQNKDTPASGKTPLKTLDEAIVNMGIDPGTGKLSLSDYFEPYDYISLDAADRDLGAAGLAILDPGVFKGRGVNRMGVTGGKNGKAYVVNLDDLGGFKLGPGGTDNCIQTITLDNSAFGGAGSYPLEGGYFYFSPSSSPLAAYKFGTDENGKPVFTLAGKSSKPISGRMGPVTVTYFAGKAGTGIVWVCDNNAGLRAFSAVPVNGVLAEMTLPPTGGLNKFGRPAFGDGRVYVTTGSGILVALGSPVNLPLSCTDPIEFDRVTVGSLKTIIVNCTARIATKINGAVLISDSPFSVKNSSLPTGQLRQAATFQFPVQWDLSNTNAGYTPGAKTGALKILTTNSVSKYMTDQPLNLRGIVVSAAPYLDVNPGVVNFDGLIVGSESASMVSAIFTISNTGSSALRISSISYALTNQIDNSGITYSPVTENRDGTTNAGTAFTLSSLPDVGQAINPGASLSVLAAFKAVNGIGNYASVLKFESNGGSDRILLSASASTAPLARFEVQDSGNGAWKRTFSVDFGNVTSGSSVIRSIRFCNDGGSPLVITKSKPPGGSELFATSMTDDLYEGQNIVAGQCATGSIKFQPVPAVPNTDQHFVSESWVLNVNDLSFGLHEVAMQGFGQARQLGPLMPDGTARYRYLGCYRDAVNGRLFSKSLNMNSNATVERCTTTGLDTNSIFVGTQYRQECWRGDTPPPDIYFYPESAAKCTWSCTGDLTQPCGGEGKFMNVFYDKLRYTPNGAIISTTTTTTRKSSSLALTTKLTSASSLSTTSRRPTTTTSRKSTTTTTVATSKKPTTSTTATTTRASSSTTLHKEASRTTTTTTKAGPPNTVMTLSAALPTGPIENPGVGPWRHIGCWTDPPPSGIKALYPFKKNTADLMTFIKLGLDAQKVPERTHSKLGL
ncbi:hypothetical protein Dda_0030 [Drechslerella dactyloides]|uniref:WSC domain-containing protein n=1 Tax=Drechslerella dactyloides TaxID=74499 RepID=A0AAD6J3L9_DREDA|nr:hypothetical protein Dda_0030 [Drechslerella dactyloides]